MVFLLATFFQILMAANWEDFFFQLFAPEILYSIRFSLVTSLVAITGAVVVGLPTAYVLSRYSFFGSGWLEALVQVPVFLPPLVAGLALLLLFSEGGTWLSIPWNNVIFSPSGVIMAQFFVATPFAVRSFTSAFSAVDRRLEQAAETMGDTPGRVFTKVTLPLAQKDIFAGIILAWSRALGEFGATIMLAGAIRQKTETMPVSIYLNMASGDLDNAITIAAIMLLMSMFLLFALRYFTGKLNKEEIRCNIL